MTSLFVHIGYPKTGTTYLQKHVFPQLPLNYIGVNYTFNLVDFLRFNSLFSRYKFPYRYKGLNDISYFVEGFDPRSYLERIRNFSEPRGINLISSENLIRPFSFELVPDRMSALKEHFDLKILIGIRSQKDLILSRYHHDTQLFKERFGSYYQLKEALSVDEVCFHPLCDQGVNPCVCAESKVKKINLKQYDFNRIDTLYRSAIGAENVFYFVYENFKDDPAKELLRLFEYMGVAGANVKSEALANAPVEKEISSTTKDEVLLINDGSYESEMMQIENYFRSSNIEFIKRNSELGLEDLGYL